MNETALSHPRLLQPLGTFPDTILKVDIYPGINSMKGVGVPYKVFDDLQSSGLDFVDSKGLNCGVLNDPKDGTEYTVVLDIPAVKELRTAEIPEDSLQKELFGHLRTAFTQAVAAKNFDPFWVLCAAENNRGLLKSPWKDDQDSLVYWPARLYEKGFSERSGIDHTNGIENNAGLNFHTPLKGPV